MECQNDELPERTDTALIRKEEMSMFLLQEAFNTTMNLAQNPKNKRKSRDSVFDSSQLTWRSET